MAGPGWPPAEDPGRGNFHGGYGGQASGYGEQSSQASGSYSMAPPPRLAPNPVPPGLTRKFGNSYELAPEVERPQGWTRAGFGLYSPPPPPRLAPNPVPPGLTRKFGNSYELAPGVERPQGWTRAGFGLYSPPSPPRTTPNPPKVYQAAPQASRGGGSAGAADQRAKAGNVKSSTRGNTHQQFHGKW